MSGNYSLSFGADPEFFATYKKDGKDFVVSPSILMRDAGLEQIDGDIKHPIFIKNSEYSWMMDGVAFELTLLKPYSNPIEMCKVIHSSLANLEEFLYYIEHPELGRLDLTIKPTVNIDPNLYIPRLGDEQIYQGFIFGCDPDLDAIDPLYKCRTIEIENHPYRYGGGHIHISGDDWIPEYPVPFVRLLAITLGNYAISHSRYPELDQLRTYLYGRPGKYRNQAYKSGAKGVEYRTPSNAWTILDEPEVEGLFDCAYKALGYLHDQRQDVIKDYLDETCVAIVNADQQKAATILSSLP